MNMRMVPHQLVNWWVGELVNSIEFNSPTIQFTKPPTTDVPQVDCRWSRHRRQGRRKANAVVVLILGPFGARLSGQ